MEKSTFEVNLLTLRFQNGFTQKEVAERIGISLAAYRKYEHGERRPDIVILKKIAQFYDVPTDWLLGLIELDSPDEAKTRAMIREYTGLSNASIKNLLIAKGEAKAAINTLLGSDYSLLYNLAHAIAKAKEVFGNPSLPADDTEVED